MSRGGEDSGDGLFSNQIRPWPDSDAFDDTLCALSQQLLRLDIRQIHLQLESEPPENLDDDDQSWTQHVRHVASLLADARGVERTLRDLLLGTLRVGVLAALVAEFVLAPVVPFTAQSLCFEHSSSDTSFVFDPPSTRAYVYHPSGDIHYFSVGRDALTPILE